MYMEYLCTSRDDNTWITFLETCLEIADFCIYIITATRLYLGNKVKVSTQFVIESHYQSNFTEICSNMTFIPRSSNIVCSIFSPFQNKWRHS